MSKSVRVRTTPNGDDNYIKVELKQDFDLLEILSLKLSFTLEALCGFLQFF